MSFKERAIEKAIEILSFPFTWSVEIQPKRKRNIQFEEKMQQRGKNDFIITHKEYNNRFSIRVNVGDSKIIGVTIKDRDGKLKYHNYIIREYRKREQHEPGALIQEIFKDNKGNITLSLVCRLNEFENTFEHPILGTITYHLPQTPKPSNNQAEISLLPNAPESDL